MYTSGATAQLIATPESNYQFSQWNDGNSNTPRNVTVTANATYTATFTALPQLSTPTGLTISGTTVTWNAVTNATQYMVEDNGSTSTQNSTSYNISPTNISHTIRVKAKASGYTDSAWTDAVIYQVPTWVIVFDNAISNSNDDPDSGNPTYDVRGSLLTFNFYSNNTTYAGIYADDASEDFLSYYTQQSTYQNVYEYYPAGWFNANWKTIRMTVDPDTVFTGDWYYWLQANADSITPPSS